MRKSLKRFVLAGSALALLASVAVAQEESAPAQDSQQSSSQPSGQQVSELRFSKLQGATAKSNDGQTLGKINDLLFDKDGQVKFAILGKQGATGQQQFAVPWQALNVRSENDYVINIDQQKWNSAPALSSNEYSDLNNPDYVIRIYRFYTIEPAPAMGAPGEEGQGVESGTKQQPGDLDQGMAPDNSDQGIPQEENPQEHPEQNPEP